LRFLFEENRERASKDCFPRNEMHELLPRFSPDMKGAAQRSFPQYFAYLSSKQIDPICLFEFLPSLWRRLACQRSL
jgi:hypothetical protein